MISKSEIELEDFIKTELGLNDKELDSVIAEVLAGSDKVTDKLNEIFKGKQTTELTKFSKEQTLHMIANNLEHNRVLK